MLDWAGRRARVYRPRAHHKYAPTKKKNGFTPQRAKYNLALASQGRGGLGVFMYA